MPTYSIGEAISLLLEQSKWKPKMHELRLREEWAQIVGKTISRYTRNLSLADKKLVIFTDVAALKQEIMFSKAQLIQSINTHFGETVVLDIIVK
jgi:predicted nucleic acid-binding Zn ribbon protein